MMARRILIYGDVNLNYRDGSAMWLQALAHCLAQTDSAVHVLLKSDIRESELREPLTNLPISIHTPFDDRQSGFAGMPPRQAAQRIVALDRRHHYDVIVSRGHAIAAQLAISGRFTGRLWPYLTEGPAFSFTQTDDDCRILQRIADESRRIFAQTEEARSLIEALSPSMTGKVLVMNPIVPDSAFEIGHDDHGPRTNRSVPKPDLSIVYAGKFARLWRTLEMTTLPGELLQVGVTASVHMIGDKFQKTGNDDDWLGKMKAAADTDSELVHWHGGLPRSEVLRELARHDVSLCWRDPTLDSSPEISTKMLESAAVGTPPVLNRSSMHEDLLGSDYPLFIDNGDVVKTLARAASDSTVVDSARAIARKAVASYSGTATATRMSEYFSRAETPQAQLDLAVRGGERRLRVVLAGHDFKFAGELLELLKQRTDIDVKIDKWTRLNQHDEEASKKYAEWADAVICEWAGPNAVFYSTHLPAHKKLLVRFHGFEIRGKWLKDINVNNVDGFIFVSDFYRKDVLHKTGWPEQISTVIYNTIDAADLQRPKLKDSCFHIGLAGYVPMLKRPDRAVDLLRRLLEHDDRYYLHLRGRLPWQYPWEWQKPAQQDAYRAFFTDLRDGSEIADHVVFENFGPDMGNWFRHIGWMLSPSTRETFHLAPVEGMASGAVPVVWNREGAEEIFGSDFVHQSTEGAAQYILSHSKRREYDAISAISRDRAERYDFTEARTQWAQLLGLPQGVSMPLWGTSILAEDTPPRDQAEAATLFYRDLDSNGLDSARNTATRHKELIPANILDFIDTWGRLDSWARDSRQLLPPAGLAPIYLVRKKLALAINTFRPQEEIGWELFSATPPASVGRPDHDVLISADSLVRATRRERPEAIFASGHLWPALAGLMAARRVGVPFICGDIHSPDLRGEPGRIARELRTMVLDEADVVLHSDAEWVDFTLPARRSVHPAKALSDARIGLVADEFTATTVAATVPTVLLKRRGWADQLDGVDAVIIESAWEGPNHEWFHGVAYHGEKDANDLWQLLEYCRSRGIPTLFWNKEDPVHFGSFARAAGQTDHVFTTDAAKIPEYLNYPSSIHRTVSSLSFFAEPTLHNPLPTDWQYSESVAFAGTFYGERYPQRSAELTTILRAAKDVGLTIYDRQLDRPHSPYQFPAEFRPYSVGAVPYSEVLQVYKSHPVHINVNSVADSPSMFSRRVVEIAASGSVVISGTGNGVSEVLGPDFSVLSGKPEWQEALSLLMADEQFRLERAWDQLRTVLRAHRADQALTLMLRTAGFAINSVELPTYGLEISDPKLLDVAARQTFPPVVLTDSADLAAEAAERGLPVQPPSSAEVMYRGALTRLVGETHYEDLICATLFAETDLITYAYDGASGGTLIEEGIGDISTGLYRTTTTPSRARHPLRWRKPQNQGPA